jgi:hypothetical protein
LYLLDKYSTISTYKIKSNNIEYLKKRSSAIGWGQLWQSKINAAVHADTQTFHTYCLPQSDWLFYTACSVEDSPDRHNQMAKFGRYATHRFDAAADCNIYSTHSCQQNKPTHMRYGNSNIGQIIQIDFSHTVIFKSVKAYNSISFGFNPFNGLVFHNTKHCP